VKEFGVTKNQIIAYGKEMRMAAFVNNKGQITDQAAFNQALMGLMEQRFKGGMAIQSKSWKGLISNAQDAMGQLLQTVSRPVFDNLKDSLASVVPVMSSFTAYVQGDMGKAMDQLKGQFTPTESKKIISYFDKMKAAAESVKKFIQDLKPAWESIKRAISGLMPLVKEVGGAIAVAWGVLAKILPPIINGLTEVTAEFIQWKGFIPLVTGLAAAFAYYKTAVMLATTYTKVFGAVQKVAAAFTVAYQVAMESAAVGTGFLTIATRTLTGAMELLDITLLANPLFWIPAVIIGVGVALYELYKHSETFRKAVQQLWKVLGDGWKWCADLFENDMVPAWERFVNYFDSDTQDLKDLWGRIKEQWRSDTDDIKQLFTEEIPAASKTMGERIKKQWESDTDDLKEFFTKKLPDAWDQFQKYMNEKSAPAENAIQKWRENTLIQLEQWKTDLFDWVDRVREELPGKLAEWGTAIKNWTSQQNEENKRQFDEWGNTISEWFKGIPERISTALETWWISISAWFTTKREQWGTNLETWWTKISEWFTSLPERTSTAIENWWISIQNWFALKREEWGTNLETWWTRINEWFTSLPERTTIALSNWWLSIQNWFITTREEWGTNLETWWTKIKEWFDGLGDKPEVKNAGKNLVKKVTEGTEEEKQTMIDKLGKFLVDVMAAALALAVVSFLAAGRELIKRIIKGMQEKHKDTSDEANSVAELIKKAITKVHWGKLGKDIVDGLIGGLKSKLTPLGSAAWNLGSTIVSSIKKRMDSHSPSRVMMEIGKDVGEGFVIGIEGTLDQVKRMAANIGGTFGTVVQKSVNTAKNIDLGGIFSFSRNDAMWKYLDEIRKTGNAKNGLLAGVPAALQEMVSKLGTSIAPKLKGANSTTLEFLQEYFNAIFEDGDYLNDWITHIPKTMKNTVAKVGQNFADLEGLIVGKVFKMTDNITSALDGTVDLARAFGSAISGAVSTGIQKVGSMDLSGLFRFSKNDPLWDYLSEIRQTGNTKNSNLADLPTMFQTAMKRLGESIAPKLKGSSAGVEEYLQRYINAIIEDGDWKNDWLTHLPKTMRNTVMNWGQDYASKLEGVSQARAYGTTTAQPVVEQNTHYWQVNADEINDVSKLMDVVNGLVQSVRSR
jgi:hypothetical protein